MKKSYYYPVVLLAILLIGLTFSTRATEGNPGWSAKYESPKVFIENKGQFHAKDAKDKILYAYDNGSTMIYFTAKGVTYSFLKRWKKDEKESEQELERKNLKSGKSHAEMEAEERKMEFKTDVISFNWENANPDVEIIPENLTTYYFSYNIKERDGSEKNINFIKAYKKIIYKNIYPNIDIEYIFNPTDGIEYSLIVHPGADITKVKMNYGGAVKLLRNGDLHIPTLFGDIVDHAPLTFYAPASPSPLGRAGEGLISSHFVKTDKTISFKLGVYDHSKTLIIDPWVQTPAMSNSNCVWECEKDGAGNVYIIGGDSPMKLRKYNSGGTMVWTYNTPWDTANYWLGTLATDLAGNSYITAGSSAKIQKINTGGSVVWSNSGGSNDEYWTIAFNCDQTKLIVGGTRLTGLPSPTGDGVIFDINTGSGSVNAVKVVGYKRTHTVFGIAVTDIEEVRSITSSRGAKYYFLTLDSIGAIDQNFSSCPTAHNLFTKDHTFAFGYKSEDYRPNNGNSGMKSIRANGNFVYAQNGAKIDKRSLSTGAILSSATITGGISTVSGGLNQEGNSGIDIDSCGNVYVGSGNAVIKYDANLNVITSVSLPFRVFDIAVSYGGNVIVSGATGNSSNTTRTGYVQSINMAACNPMVLFCCDATVCPAGPFCTTDSPFTLTPVTAGGTWSGAGVNASTGVFSPSVAGVGTHVISYTLSCGSDSISIIVSPCLTLTACQETNGNITVSNGTAPYTWKKDSTYTDCSSCLGGNCIPGFCTGVQSTISTTFATGTTITPPGTYPIHVIDANSTTLIITSLASLPNCSNTCPTLTVTASNIINDSCFGQSAGSFSASTTGGASPWDYVLKNSGGTTIATFSNIAGAQSFTGLAAGTYTLNVLDNNACPGTTTITITQPPAAATIAAAGPDQSICSNSASLAGNAPTVGTGIWTLVSGTGTITMPSSATSGITGLGAGATIFKWTINNAPCPSTSDQVTITNTGGGAAAAGADQSICSSSAILAGNTAGTGTGLWTLISGTATITNPSSPTSGLTGVGIGTIVLEWTINNPPCPASSDQITITNTGGGPSVTITSQTNISCYGGNNGSATASATGGTGTLTYLWAASGGAAATANNLTAGTYTVSVTDGNGCVGIQTVSIIQPDSISAQISTTPTTCGSNSGSATVAATGGTGNLTYSWNNGGATTSTINNIGAGSHSVIITDSLGCTKTVSGTVSSNGGPTANAGADVTISSGTSTQLSASGGGTYLWTPPTGLDCDTCQNPMASPIRTTTYCLMVSNNSGCSDTDCVTVTVLDTVPVKIECGTVYVPNAFSPGNNDLLNDTFKPVTNCVHEYSFIIFNRWGEKIFETSDTSEGWNGLFKGKICKQDVYIYKISFLDDTNNDFHQDMGKVILLR